MSSLQKMESIKLRFEAESPKQRGKRIFGTIVVQVWSMEVDDEPCNEGNDGFNNIVVSEWDIPEEIVVELAKKYDIPLEPKRGFNYKNHLS